MSHKCSSHLISSFYYRQLRFYYAKLLDMPEEDRQVLRFVDPVLDSNDEDGNIFEPERSFSCVFNTFVTQSCVKKDKNLFKATFRFLLFLKFLKCWKLTHMKNSSFNTTA